MTQPDIACMGGWCSLRERCPQYHAVNRSHPAERLCHPGRDGVLEDWQPMVMVGPVDPERARAFGLLQ